MCLQVTVQMQVDRSRKVCEAVARGETDVAVVGGEVPTELCDVLQVSQRLCCMSVILHGLVDGF